MVYLDKFIAPFIDFVEESFADFDRHVFFCFGDEVAHHPLRRCSNILYKSDYRRASLAYFELGRLMYQSDKIILHGLWSEGVVRLLSIQPWLLKKCYWVIWGGDLYSFEFKERDLTWHINEIPRRIVIKRLGNLVTYVSGDVDLARRWYGARGKYRECLMYPSNLYKEHKVPMKSDNAIHIQIGNSADPTNEHFEMLQMLEPYKTENIRIYVPLSYGDSDHATRVAAEGKRIFGGKFVALTDLMPMAEYIEYLTKIDIAIFNHRRQQAMGNIITLLGMGKKVYLRKDVTSWSVFEKIGVKLYELQFFGLNEMDDQLAQKNMKIMRLRFSSLVLKEQWNRIFE